MAEAGQKEALTTRYEKVKAILDLAQGRVQADYQGHGAFWRLPLAQFKQVTIYGVQMIAPAESHHCQVVEPVCVPEQTAVSVINACCAVPEDEAQKAESLSQAATLTEPMPGRGAASGLIKGLRGQFPFDGSRFPRLPWGGTAVAEADIQFIEEWIDDGCPEDDRLVNLEAQPTEAAALTQIEMTEPAYTVYALPTNEYKYRSGELRQRVNLACLSPLQLEKLRHAFRELYNLNDWPADRRNYNNLALIHQNHCQHAWERFLPWHRVYLYEFEQALQDFCPDVTLPYWDWPMPLYKNGVYQTEGDYHEQGGQIPEAYRAFLTPDSIENLQQQKLFPAKVLKKLEGMVCRTYTSLNLFFKAVAKETGDVKYTQAPYRHSLIYELLQANALWYPLRYPAEFYDQNHELSTINQIIGYHYPTAAEVAQIQSLTNFRDYGGGSIYNDSYGYLDQNPHNTLHIWSGGQNPDFNREAENAVRGVRIARRRPHSKEDLYSQPEFGDMFSNLTASYDPIFWPHHVNVDRLWSEWQVEHPNCVPSDLTAALTPWNYTVKDVLDIHAFGYEYVKGCYVFMADNEHTIGRFVSGPAHIPPFVLQNHRQVEIRLHRVPQLPLSCYIRAFLNQPDANANTPIEENDHYAGYVAVFGHGVCYGGPGHCALPPDQPRQFDRRGRSHNTPRTYRIDVTTAVQRLVKQGATDLQVTLVVVGVDGKENRELLRLDGVSFNFRD